MNYGDSFIKFIKDRIFKKRQVLENINKQINYNRSILFRKFEPITPQPEPINKSTTKVVEVFKDYEWLRRIGFNQYLTHLQFSIDKEGNIIRTFCGEEVKQVRYEDW